MHQTAKVRIATWNLEGKWTAGHLRLITSLRADVLLLTEVLEGVQIDAQTVHLTEGEMRPGRRWAAIAAHTLRPLPDPHGATALAEVKGLRVASSILPWRNSGAEAPWVGTDQGSRTAHAAACIQTSAPVIWGGDWNHELTGRIYAGSKVGREGIGQALDELGLVAPTDAAPHRIPSATTIDHIAVPAFWTLTSVERVSTIVDGVALSDHDAYVVEIE